MNIVDLGKFKQKKQTETGFYMVANCPQCTMPLYWHGPGIMNGQEIGEMLYPSCSCDWEGEIELTAPDEYNFEIERHSLNILFRNMYQMMQEQNDVQQEDSDSSRDSEDRAGILRMDGRQRSTGDQQKGQRVDDGSRPDGEG